MNTAERLADLFAAWRADIDSVPVPDPLTILTVPKGQKP